MKSLTLTLDSSVENIALDEAILETAESTDDHPEVLRIWEPIRPVVVLGRSSPIEAEVNLQYCRENGIDVVRRCSGGQTIVSAPGCLMYMLLLDYRLRPGLRMLEQAHQFVMGRMCEAICHLNIPVQIRGTSDLTFNGRKFSGNSLRCKRNWMIYHGTMICHMDVGLIDQCLGQPIRQPEYRENRSHLEFLTQLPTSTRPLTDAITKTWGINGELESWPVELMRSLVATKYSSTDWTNNAMRTI